MHHAIDILEPAADAAHDQAQAAAEAGRLLVPTVSLPRADSTQLLAPAPDDRVGELLAFYRDAGQAGADAALPWPASLLLSRRPAGCLLRSDVPRGAAAY